MNIQEKYSAWLKYAEIDSDLIKELKSISENSEAISDRFFKDLEFGTGGLRGEIGAGTNRMNVYTVGKVTQAIADFINSDTNNGKVAIAYDSRIKSDLFAKTAAGILAENGIKVYIYKELMPTPMLSFAVRHFGCNAGIVITASHNPAKYNGYKAYGSDGCQLNLEASQNIYSIMDNIDIFKDIKFSDFELQLKKGNIVYIEQDTIDAYLDEVQKCSVAEKNTDLSKLKVIYTPLHGSGNKPVRSILKRIGISDVTVVPEQELPNGNFPTVEFPNPEFRQAFECSLKLAENINPDLLLATDPDCDRVGIAVKYGGEYKLLTGNDVGSLLLDYILKRRIADGTLPENPIAIKTIVTSELSTKIAASYNIELRNVLTGFKFIGEQIALLEANNEKERFIFGYEESYGYLAGTYVRDKDAVVASMLICEMIAYYQNQGTNLIDVLNGLYEKFGYYYNTQQSFTFEGETGMKKIASVLSDLRKNPPKEIAKNKVVSVSDYSISVTENLVTKEKTPITLPKSDVLSYEMSDGSHLIVRPSGTEPKIKFYINAVADSNENCIEKSEQIKNYCKKFAGVQ